MELKKGPKKSRAMLPDFIVEGGTTSSTSSTSARSGSTSANHYHISMFLDNVVDEEVKTVKKPRLEVKKKDPATLVNEIGQMVQDVIWEYDKNHIDVSKVHACIAKIWVENEEQFYDANPTQFLSDVYKNSWYGILKLWKTLVEFKLEFEEQKLNARRDDLIMNGVKAVNAERYLVWIAKEDLWYKFQFRPFNRKLLKDNVKFSLKMDTALLNVVFEQEGAFMDRAYMQWEDANQTMVLSGIHEEHLKHRFMQLKANWSQEYLDRFEFSDIYAQKQLSIDRERTQTLVKIKEHERWMNIILQDANFDGANYFYWIKLSKKVGEEEDVETLRLIIVGFIADQNPKIRMLFQKKLNNFEKGPGLEISETSEEWNCLRKKITRILWTEDFPKDISLDFTAKHNIQIDFNEAKLLFQQTRKSMLVVYQTFFAKKVPTEIPMTAFDGLVFSTLHKINFDDTIPEQTKKHGFYCIKKELYPSYEIESKEVLTKEDISKMFDDDDEISSPNDMHDNDFEFLAPAATEQFKRSRYGDMFCFRKLSKFEWSSLLEQAYKSDKNFDDLQIDDTWELLKERSKINTSKTGNQLRKEFLKDILPVLNDYVNPVIASYIKTT